MGAPKGNRYAAKYDDGKMDELIEDLLDYAENAKSIHLAKWCRKHGFSKKWLNETAKHYPELEEAIEVAHDLIAQKIVDSSFWDKESGVNATFGHNYLAVYDKDFKALLKWKAELAKEMPSRDINKEPFNEWKEQQKKS